MDLKNYREFELIPTDGRKSFYHKALVIQKGNIALLKSYETIVASYNTKTKQFTRHWNDESRTTTRHINAFLNAFGIPGGGVNWWREQEVKPFNWVSFYVGKPIFNKSV